MTKFKIAIFISLLIGSTLQAQKAVVSTFAGRDHTHQVVLGANAVYNLPYSVVVSGNYLYVAEEANHRIRKINLTSGTVSILAGGKGRGFADGKGKKAKFSNPTGLAISGKYLYVADYSNHKIRKVDTTTGAVTTLAGGSSPGFADGTGTDSKFNSPIGLVVLGEDLFVTDRNNHSIRKINIKSRKVTTLAGNNTNGFNDDFGSKARFYRPTGIVASQGALYVADSKNNKIRKIEIATKKVTTIAGSTEGFAEGIGSHAKFNYPEGLALSGDNLYIVDHNNHRIRKLQISTRTVTTIAGSTRGYLDGKAQVAKLNGPRGVAVVGDMLYIADAGNHKIRKLNQTSKNVTTIEGRILIITKGNADGKGKKAEFNSPTGIVASGDYLYVADKDNHRIRAIHIASQDVTTLAGSVLGIYDDKGKKARFKYPTGLAVSGNHIYIVESSGFIRVVYIPTGAVDTIYPYSVDVDPDMDDFFEFEGPVGLAYSKNNLYVSDNINHSIYKLENEFRVTTLAGGTWGFRDGKGKKAQFSSPSGVAVLGNYLYALDEHRIRKIHLKTGVVTTFAGSSILGYKDDIGKKAKFNNPRGIATSGNNIYITDTGNHRIRKIDATTGEVTTIAGSTRGYLDGFGDDVKFDTPVGITVVGNVLYVADQKNHRIRKLVLCPTIAQPTATTQTFCEGKKVSDLKATVKAGETMHWYTTATGGKALTKTARLETGEYYAEAKNTGGCVSDKRTKVTITINTIPNSPTTTASAQSFCSGKTVADLKVAVKADETIKWYDKDKGGALLSSNTKLKTSDYFAEAKNNCGISTQRTKIAVTINATPDAPRTTATTQSFCQGSTVADLKATVKAGETMHWYATATGGKALTKTAQLETGEYHTEAKNTGGCVSDKRTKVVVTINVTPDPPRTTATTQSFCQGSTVADLKATVKAGETMHWYATATGGKALTKTAQLETGEYYAEAKNTGGCVSDRRTKVVVTINVTPDPPRTTATTQSFCQGSTVADLKVAVKADETIKWYDKDKGGALLSSNTKLKTSDYFAEAKNNCGISTQRTKIAVTINATPDAPRTTATTQSFCQGSTVADLKATVKAGETMHWYATATGGKALTKTAQLETGEYHTEAKNTGGCVSDKRTKVVVTINVTPDPPRTTATTQSFCQGSTVADLKATVKAGETMHWYATATGGKALTKTAQLETGEYYAEAKNTGGCVSDRRTKVVVTINVTPDPPRTTATTQSFCQGSTVADLKVAVKADETIKWYDKDKGGALLSSNTKLKTSDYFAEAKNNCGISTQRTKIAVTINATPDAPRTTATTQSFCQGSTVADLKATVKAGETMHWYATATGGKALTKTAQLETGEYHAEAKNTDGCVSHKRTKVTVTIKPKEDCTTTGITELDDLGISLYPNPATHQLTIDRGDHNDLQVQIIDHTGRRLMDLKTTKQLTEWDMSDYASGIYLISITTESHHVVERLVKE